MWETFADNYKVRDEQEAKDLMSQSCVEYGRQLMSDNVNHPAHYTNGNIECIDAIQAQLTVEEFRGFLKGQVAKYNWREKHKNGTEDCKKAQWYLNRLIQFDAECAKIKDGNNTQETESK